MGNHVQITFVLQYFYPEVASTAQLMTELAESLVLRGCEVRVFTGQPTYLRAEKLPKEEVYKRIEIQRLSCTRFNKNNPAGRILNWLSFTLLAFWRLLFSKQRSMLFIVSTPPFLFIVGYLLNIAKRQRYACLVYDLYPEIAERLGYIQSGGLISRVWNKLNREFFRRASFVVVPDENMRSFIEQKTGQNKPKIKVIPNWADGNFIKPIKKKDNWFCTKYDLVNKFVVLYSGNIGLFHNLETLVEAAHRLRKEKDVRFVFIGEGGKKEKLVNMAKQKNLENVVFLPYQDKSVLPYSLACGDISVVSLEKGLDCVAAPCKLYTSLAAGSVILGLTDDDSVVARIIDEFSCGFNVSQRDSDELIKKLRRLRESEGLLDKQKKNARRCFEENFQREDMIEKYYELFTERKGEVDA